MPELAITLWVAIVSGAISAGAILLVVARVWHTEKNSEESASNPWLLRAPLLPLVLAVVSGLVAVYALILHYAFGAADFQLPDQANITSPILVAATLIAGTLTAAYAVLKLRAHLITEARGKLDASGEERAGERHRNDQEAAYSERFAEAVKLLADDRSISRIAGAHLVLAIGDEWKSTGAQQRCFDVLLSHLRGLNLDESFDDEVKSRSRREEVRLITSEILRRLGKDTSGWGISNADFNGAVLTDLDFNGISDLSCLDLRSTHILGHLTIAANVSKSAPRLSGLVCDGDLVIRSGSDWGEEINTALEINDADVAGSVVMSGTPSSRTLGMDVLASGLTVGGDLQLDFDIFLGDVILDTASVGGFVTLGSPDRGASFGTFSTIDDKPEIKPTSVSAVGATFGLFQLRRSRQAARLDLSEASGAVDLTGSIFQVEVTANNLDASAGLRIEDARFESSFILDGATTPDEVDLQGVFFSPMAKAAFKASHFFLSEEFLDHDEEIKFDRPFEDNRAFDWRPVIRPYREQYSADLIDDLEARLERLDASLPVDWHARPTFTAKVMSAVSRAAAKADAPREVELALQRTLRHSLQLASDEQDRQ